MGHEYIYICDKCKKKSVTNILDRYEIHTDYCSDKLHKAENTKTLELCSLCAAEILEIFKDKGAE